MPRIRHNSQPHADDAKASLPTDSMPMIFHRDIMQSKKNKEFDKRYVVSMSNNKLKQEQELLQISSLMGKISQ